MLDQTDVLIFSRSFLLFFFYVILTYLQALIVHEFSAKVNLKKKKKIKWVKKELDIKKLMCMSSGNLWGSYCFICSHNG